MAESHPVPKLFSCCPCAVRGRFFVGADWLAPQSPSPSFLRPPRDLTTGGVRTHAGPSGRELWGGKARSCHSARTASPEGGDLGLAGWPTVAGRETSGSIGFPFLAGDVAVGVDHARGRRPSEHRRSGPLRRRTGRARAKALKTVNPRPYLARSSSSSLEVRSRACVTLPPLHWAARQAEPTSARTHERGRIRPRGRTLNRTQAERPSAVPQASHCLMQRSTLALQSPSAGQEPGCGGQPFFE